MVSDLGLNSTFGGGPCLRGSPHFGEWIRCCQGNSEFMGRDCPVLCIKHMKVLSVFVAGAVLVGGALAASFAQSDVFSQPFSRETNYDQQIRYSSRLSFEQLLINSAYGGFNGF